MNFYPGPAGAPWLVLAPGAGAGHEHPWMTRVAGGLAGRGVSVATFNFPYREKGRGAPDPAPVLEAAFAAAWREAHAAPGAGNVRMFAGGKSMGGRVATQAAARGLLQPAPAGIVCFGYPLHPPGKPGQRRDAHLPGVTCPMLFLQGSRDPFGSPEEMTALAADLHGLTLDLIDGGDHSLARPKRQDPDGRALEDAVARAADWILAAGSR